MFNNPLITRYQKSSMRPKQLLIFTSIYIVSLLMIGLINYSGLKYNQMYQSYQEMYKSIFGQLALMQFIVLWAWSSINSGSAIREEIMSNSYDFFRLLPLSAFKKATGIIIGKNIFVYMLAIINFVLLIISGTFGEISFNLQIQFYITMIAVAFLANSISLLVPIQPSKNKKNHGLVIGLLFGAFFVVPMFINIIAVILDDRHKPETFMVWFYGMQIPVMITIAVCTAYMGCWVFKGVLRKFTFEDKPLFTKMGAIFFVSALYIIVLGFSVKYFGSEDDIPLHYLLWLLTILPTVVVFLLSAVDLDSYIETAGDIYQSSFSPAKAFGVLFKQSNIMIALILFAIWTLFAFITSYLEKVNLAEDAKLIVVIFSSFMFLILILEMAVVLQPINKIGFLVAFILGLYVILPMVLSGVMDNELLIVYSPMGFFIRLIDRGGNDVLYDEIKITVLLLNVLLCVIPFIVNIKKYKYALASRSNMQEA